MAADEDKILFGDMNARIADEFWERIEAALVEGVASLPLMGSSSSEDNHREERMFQILRKAYIRNVDLLEIYNGRNIFSVAHRTAHFRRRVLDAFMARETGGGAEHNQESTPKDDDATRRIHWEPKLPPKEDIPTPEQVTELEEEIKTLRQQLKQAQTLRAQKLKQCRAMEEAATFSQQAKETLAAVPALGKVSALVQSMAEAQNEYKSLMTQGKQLIQKMDEIKSERDENADNGKLPSPPPKRTKKLTLEEHYEEQRSILGENRPADLFKLRDLLKPKPGSMR